MYKYIYCCSCCFWSGKWCSEQNNSGRHICLRGSLLKMANQPIFNRSATSTSAFSPYSLPVPVSTPSAHICFWECKQSLCRIAVRSTPDQSRIQTPEARLSEKLLRKTGYKMYQAQTVQAKHVWMTASVLPFLATPVSQRVEFWLQPTGFSTQQNLQVNPKPHDPENMKQVRLNLTFRPKSTNEWMDLPLL